VDGAYSVNSKGQLFVYHTLPEVTSISSTTGGDAEAPKSQSRVLVLTLTPKTPL